MKKYLFGVFAIALAVMFSAYNTKTADAHMVYIGSTAPTSASDLNNLANWQEQGTFQLGTEYTCGGQDPAFVCTIDINEGSVSDYISSGSFISGVSLNFSSLTAAPLVISRPTYSDASVNASTVAEEN